MLLAWFNRLDCGLHAPGKLFTKFKIGCCLSSNKTSALGRQCSPEQYNLVLEDGYCLPWMVKSTIKSKIWCVQYFVVENVV